MGGDEQPAAGAQRRDPDARGESGAVQPDRRELAALAGGARGQVARVPPVLQGPHDRGELRDEQVGGLAHEHGGRRREHLGGHRVGRGHAAVGGDGQHRVARGVEDAERRLTAQRGEQPGRCVAPAAPGLLRRVGRRAERRPTWLSLPHVGPPPLRRRRPRDRDYNTCVIHDRESVERTPNPCHAPCGDHARWRDRPRLRDPCRSGRRVNTTATAATASATSGARRRFTREPALHPLRPLLAPAREQGFAE